jgi:hypothetical protein
MILWSWESQAGGQCGGGVSGDEKRARRAAAAWMRAHGAGAALLEQVRLAVGDSLLPVYERTGLALAGRLHRGRRVIWRPAAGTPVRARGSIPG